MLRLAGVGMAVAAIMALAPAGLAGQAPAKGKTARTWNPPKTPWGEPDLQGIYSNKTITPFERPAEFAGKADTEQRGRRPSSSARAEARSADNGRNKGTEGDVSRAYNDFWWDRGKKVTTQRARRWWSIRRTDTFRRSRPRPRRARPRNTSSRLPRRRRQRPRRRLDWPIAAFRALHHARHAGRDVAAAYNNNYRIVQGPGYVAVQIEMLGGTRVIPTDGRPHVGSTHAPVDGRFARPLGRQHAGRRHHQFHRQALYRGAAENLKLVERFTRVDPTRSTITSRSIDPTTFTQAVDGWRFRS